MLLAGTPRPARRGATATHIRRTERQRDMSTRTAVVTGASGGIGAATARKLAEAGFHVVLTARRTDRLDALAKELTADGRSVAVHALDVTDRAAVDAFAAGLDRCDVLVNNAGGAVGSDPVATADPADWRLMFE